MKKKATVKTTKNTKSNTNDLNITIVGEFKGHSVYIMGDKFIAKEFSEYMKLGFDAILFIEQNYDNKIALSPKNKK